MISLLCKVLGDCNLTEAGSEIENLSEAGSAVRWKTFLLKTEIDSFGEVSNII